MTHLKDKRFKDQHYMKFALAEAGKALDQGEFPVGCVIVFDETVVASGSRKGTASAISSDVQWANRESRQRASEIDHAEIRALHYLEHNIAHSHFVDSENSSINSSSNIDIVAEQCALYCTMEPCLMCFGAIILSGIQRVIYAFEDPMGGGTSCDLGKLTPLYQKSNITVLPHILRDESLKLFTRFFLRKENLYWKDSLLEKYTLEQAKLCD